MWKCEAVEKLRRGVRPQGSRAREERDGEITKLYPKIGQLVVKRIFVENLRSVTLNRMRTMIDPVMLDEAREFHAECLRADQTRICLPAFLSTK